MSEVPTHQRCHSKGSSPIPVSSAQPPSAYAAGICAASFSIRRPIYEYLAELGVEPEKISRAIVKRPSLVRPRTGLRRTGRVLSALAAPLVRRSVGTAPPP